MTKFIGRLVNVGVAKESTRGTFVAPTLWVPKATFDHDDKVQKARSQVGYGTIGIEGNQNPVALRWAEGSMETDFYMDAMGFFLYAALGSVSTSGPSDSAYTHTFTLAATNTHQSLSLVVDDPVGDTAFVNAMIKGLQIKVVPEETVKVKVDFESKGGFDWSGQTASYTAKTLFVGRDLIFKIASTTSELAAASALSLKSLTLTISKNTIRDHVLGTVQPEDVLNQGFAIDGEIELNYEDRTYRDYMLNGNYKAVRIQLVNNRDVIGAATSPSFMLDLSRVDFEAWESMRPNDEIAKQKITFHALFDVTNSNIINSCQLVNATTSY